MLAAAGLLDGYTVTTHWAFIASLTGLFPNVSVAPDYPRYCLDRNRLTEAASPLAWTRRSS